MNDTQKRPSLKDRDAAQIRNEQRGGSGSIDPRSDAPEANDTMRRVWSEPGGEAHAYRNATIGAGGKADNHADLTAAETPDTTTHLSDPSLPRRGGKG